MDATPARTADSAYHEFLGVERFGSLDGLRFLSILAVLWHHSGISVDDAILHRGQLGVHLFFAISGFLITSLMIRERRRYGRISLAKFYARRSLRIFPLYYAVLGAYTVLVYATERHGAAGEEFFGNLPAFITYTSNWFVRLDAGGRVIFYFAWSLAVEEQFYLTWPWVERYVNPAARMTLLGLVIAAVGANHFGLLAWAIPKTGFAGRVLWMIAPCILFGVLSAHVLHARRGFGLAWRVFGRRWSAPVALALLLGAVSVERSSMGWEYVIYLLLVGLVVACVIREDNGLAGVLRLKPLARVGVISYGIYLMHMLCFNASRRVGGLLGITSKWALWIGGLLLVYLVAELSFRTFERFFQNRKRSYVRLRHETEGVPPVPSDPLGAQAVPRSTDGCGGTPYRPGCVNHACSPLSPISRDGSRPGGRT